MKRKTEDFRAEPEVTGSQTTVATPQFKVTWSMGGLATIVMAAMAAFHIYMGATAPLPSMQQRAVHLSFGLMAVFLLYPPRSMAKPDGRRKFSIIDLILVAASALIGIVIYSQYNAILQQLQPETWQIVMTIVATLLVLEGARRTTGKALPILAIIFIVYAYFGANLPGLFQHSGSGIEQIARNLFLSTEGILGIALGVSATYVILFVIFGSLLQLTGTGDLMLKLSNVLVGGYRGGQAKGATIASGFFGSISGSQVGNVAATGPVTIPLMRATGFDRRTAGAVEATASTGGMFMPPIMGATAFLIAEILQIPYADVVLAAVLPAVLYYLALLFTIDLRAAKTGMHGTREAGKWRSLPKLLLRQGYLLLPLAILVYLLIVAGSSPARAAFWGITIAAAIAVVAALVNRDWRAIVRVCVQGAIEGVRSALIIVMATACAGIIVGMMGVTGLGFRLSFILTEFAGSSVIALLLLTMIASIVLGMGLPAVAAYIVLAITVAPALADLGVTPLAAHMYVFYFGVLAAITPPVALAAFTAAGISGDSPHKTAFTALKFALAGFLIPFMFVMNPALLLDGTPIAVIHAFASSVLGVFALAVAVEGYLFRRLAIWLRLLSGAGAITLLAPGLWSDFAGLALIVIVGVIAARTPKEDAREKAHRPARGQSAAGNKPDGSTTTGGRRE